MLQAADALGLVDVSPILLNEVADSLDVMAETCRPSGDAFTNPAKALAVEFGESLPVIAGAGELASVAARLFADRLQLFAGVPGVAVSLPDGAATAGALLTGDMQDSFDDEFFRDRSAESATRPRLVTIGDDGEEADEALGPPPQAPMYVDEVAAQRAAAALHRIASQRGLRSSTIDVGQGPALARFAAATAFAGFTATYLALARGMDPSEPRPGELPH
jgi:hypothetical protein